MKKNKIFIYLPSYTESSNGIKLLWFLASELSKNYDVLINEVNLSPVNYEDFKTKFPNMRSINFEELHIKNNDVCIVPDSIAHIDKRFNYVIRYFMSKPFILNGDFLKKLAKYEYFLSYSKCVSYALPQLYLLGSDIFKIKKNNIKSAKKITFYFGKCRIKRNSNLKIITKIINKYDIEIITRTEPNDKHVLEEIFNESLILISFDPFSSICLEANLRDIPVLIADDAMKESYNSFNHKFPGFYYLDEIDENDFKSLIKRKNKNIRAKTITEINKFSISHQKKEILTQINIAYNTVIKFNESNYKSQHTANQNFINESLDFYFNKWDSSPIYHCTSLKSLIGYLLLLRAPFLYFSYIYSLIIIRKFKNFLQSLGLTENAVINDYLKYNFFKKNYILNKKKLFKNKYSFSYNKKILTTKPRKIKVNSFVKKIILFLL